MAYSSSSFLTLRLVCGLWLPQSRADAKPADDCDVPSDKIGFSDNGSFSFSDDDKRAELGDVELRPPVEDEASRSWFESRRRFTGKGSVLVRIISSFLDNVIDSITSTNVDEKPSSRSRNSNLGGRLVDIISQRTSASNGVKNVSDCGKKLMSVRESLLIEAWERKRDLKQYAEISRARGHTKPGHFDRSSSDCGKPYNSPSEGVQSRPRIRKYTDDDLDELRGFMDLGFQFSEDSIPHLCDTLPALEVYWAIKQTLEQSPRHTNLHHVPEVQSSPSLPSSPTSSWKLACPGDEPHDVKAKLRLWAHAVACNARQV